MRMLHQSIPVKIDHTSDFSLRVGDTNPDRFRRVFELKHLSLLFLRVKTTSSLASRDRLLRKTLKHL